MPGSAPLVTAKMVPSPTRMSVVYPLSGKVISLGSLLSNFSSVRYQPYTSSPQPYTVLGSSSVPEPARKRQKLRSSEAAMVWTPVPSRFFTWQPFIPAEVV